MQTTCARQKQIYHKQKSFQYKYQRNKFHDVNADILLHINGKLHTRAADLNAVSHSFLLITEKLPLLPYQLRDE